MCVWSSTHDRLFTSTSRGHPQSDLTSDHSVTSTNRKPLVSLVLTNPLPCLVSTNVRLRRETTNTTRMWLKTFFRLVSDRKFLVSLNVFRSKDRKEITTLIDRYDPDVVFRCPLTSTHRRRGNLSIRTRSRGERDLSREVKVRDGSATSEGVNTRSISHSPPFM